MLIGLAVVAVLFVVRWLSPQGSAGAGLPNAARDFATLSISVVIESLPFVFLGIVLSIAVQIWLPEGLLLRRLPRNAMLRRMVLSMLGMLLPVCECGNVPLARGLMVKGLTVAESMTFLFAAPILNPITIITTQQAFGWDNNILAARIVGGFAIANLVGWIYSRHPRPDELLTPRFQAACAVADHHDGRRGRAARSVRMFVQETSAMMPALFIGAALAGLIQVAVSREVLLALGSDPVWSVLALMLLAFVVAICSNVDAFFILSFGATFMPGAIVAFLVFGPMIDVKMLALLRTTFTAKALLQVSLLVALSAAVLGLAVNYVS
ncbi:permease [Arthrobacter sp. 35W]|uniref:permease n=1 Tax=Arthrobacter sp. 35W TaxID=1132441 RepID=UPI0003FBEE73